MLIFVLRSSQLGTLLIGIWSESFVTIKFFRWLFFTIKNDDELSDMIGGYRFILKLEGLSIQKYNIITFYV